MTTVRIPPTLRTETDGVREVQAAGATVREVLIAVASRYPALGDRLFDDGDVARFVNVYVGGEDVRTQEGLDTPVTDGATVILLPAMAGGAFPSLAGGSSRPAEPAPRTASAR